MIHWFALQMLPYQGASIASYTPGTTYVVVKNTSIESVYASLCDAPFWCIAPFPLVCSRQRSVKHFFVLKDLVAALFYVTYEYIL